MIVCLCKGVSDREIRAAMGAGYTTLQALGRHLGAGRGTGCGACHRSLREMVAKHTQQPALPISEPSQSGTFKLASFAPNGYLREDEEETAG